LASPTAPLYVGVGSNSNITENGSGPNTNEPRSGRSTVRGAPHLRQRNSQSHRAAVGARPANSGRLPTNAMRSTRPGAGLSDLGAGRSSFMAGPTVITASTSTHGSNRSGRPGATAIKRTTR
jgi:hypothetical protein